MKQESTMHWEVQKNIINNVVNAWNNFDRLYCINLLSIVPAPFIINIMIHLCNCGSSPVTGLKTNQLDAMGFLIQEIIICRSDWVETHQLIWDNETGEYSIVKREVNNHEG